MSGESVSKIRERWIGKEWPVWWETNDGRPSGEHRATVLDVLPYTGSYKFIACIFRLSAPNNSKGWAEMSIEKTPLRHAEAYAEDEAEAQQMDHDRHNNLPIDR